MQLHAPPILRPNVSCAPGNVYNAFSNPSPEPHMPLMFSRKARRRLHLSLRASALSLACLAAGVFLGRHQADTLPQQTARQHNAAQPGAAAKDPYQFFDTLVDLRSQILHNYVENVDDQKLLDGAIKGMMSELDPYSNYFTKDRTRCV